MTSFVLEFIPALLVTIVLISMVVTSVLDTNSNDKYKEWAMNLVSMYIGKALADQTHKRAQEHERQMYLPPHTHGASVDESNQTATRGGGSTAQTTQEREDLGRRQNYRERINPRSKGS